MLSVPCWYQNSLYTKRSPKIERRLRSSLSRTCSSADGGAPEHADGTNVHVTNKMFNVVGTDKGAVQDWKNGSHVPIGKETGHVLGLIAFQNDLTSRPRTIRTPCQRCETHPFPSRVTRNALNSTWLGTVMQTTGTDSGTVVGLTKGPCAGVLVSRSAQCP